MKRPLVGGFLDMVGVLLERLVPGEKYTVTRYCVRQGKRAFGHLYLVDPLLKSFIPPDKERKPRQLHGMLGWGQIEPFASCVAADEGC